MVQVWFVVKVEDEYVSPRRTMVMDWEHADRMPLIDADHLADKMRGRVIKVEVRESEV